MTATYTTFPTVRSESSMTCTGAEMVLHISTAIGTGTTELAAFDDALLRVGAANYNLIRLSSVIPPSSRIVECDGPMPSCGGAWGDRLYVVYAEQRVSRPGRAAWAGVGWVQDDRSGQGLFVEHEGDDELTVRTDIVASLSQLQAGRDMRPGRIRMRVVGATCVDQPVCALALCAFGTEPWRPKPVSHT